MHDADALRTLADTTRVASYVPTLHEVLHRAADALERQDTLIMSLEAEIQRLSSAGNNKG